MRDASTRHIYLNELRPPIGYLLDRAVATTFSLDLLALLMAPLSMALNECGSRETAAADPIATLEALRRTADRFAVFVQQGRIAVPKVDSLLYTSLERAVVEVGAPNGGVFHPKIWVLRYVHAEGAEPPFYRLLCLSRNLTFDRSWDTVVALEGYLDERRRNSFSQNEPLADFLAALPEMAAGSVPAAAASHAAFLADEVRRVRFEAPDGIDGWAFLPAGLRRKHRRIVPPDEFNRALIVSPFLSPEVVRPLARRGRENILVSRAEALDALPPDLLDAMAARTSIFVMHEEAELPDGSTDQGEPVAQVGPDLAGLHAKVFIWESGWDADFMSGSANATMAALDGHNVEFAVQMRGKRSQTGIDWFLGTAGDRNAFRGLLQPYRRPDVTTGPDTLGQQLEQALEEARTAVTSAGFCALITPDGPDTYRMTITAKTPLSLPMAVTGGCRPLSLKAPDSKGLEPLTAPNGEARFVNLSAAALTGFFAFELTACVSGRKAQTAFVLNLPVAGMPADRDERVLHAIIADKQRFLRYLLFLLAEGSDTMSIQSLLTGSGSDVAAGSEGGIQLGLPVLEELVRAFSREPAKIDRIGKLVADLSPTAEGRDLFPEGFLELWSAFAEAQRGGRNG